MTLESPTMPFVARPDRRPRIPEPPPVRLVTVEDAHLPARAGVETQLDAFYVGLLRFERDPEGEFPVYRSANFRLRFDVLEPPIYRETLRPLGVAVPSLAALERDLIDREIEYTRHRGLLPGQDTLLLLDPAGNWVELSESREV